MHMIKQGILAGMMAALILAGGLTHTTWAQVAAPRHNPTALESAVPSNPAARAFQRKSRTGAFWINLNADLTDGVAAVPLDKFEGEGLAYQMSYIGDTFAFNGEQFSSDVVKSPVGATTYQNPYLMHHSLVELAMRFGIMSFGIGQQTRHQSRNLPGVPLQTQNYKSLVYGVSVQAHQIFHLGFATGKETEDWNDQTTKASGESRLRRIGAAYHSRRVHAEFYREVADEEKQGAGSEERVAEGVSLEMLFGTFFVSYETYKADTKNPGVTTPQTGTEKRTTTQIGYVPEYGWAITLGQMTLEDNEDTTTGVKYTGQSFGVAYQF